MSLASPLIESFIDSDIGLISNRSLKSILCLGNAKKDAIEALSACGDQFRSYHSGYNREIVGPR